MKNHVLLTLRLFFKDVGPIYFSCRVHIFFVWFQETMFLRRSKTNTGRAKRVRLAVPHGHGTSVSASSPSLSSVQNQAYTSVSASSPPLSSVQNQAYTMELAGINRPLGGAMGCSYTGFSHGVVCQNTGGMPDYKQSTDSYTGDWAANVRGGFPHPRVESPGGYDQIAMGGGSGSPECARACSCQGDPSCACSDGCGYTAVNQTCVEPIPGGEYASLVACEAAHSRGNYKA